MSHLLNRKVLVVIPCYLFQENTIIFEKLKFSQTSDKPYNPLNTYVWDGNKTWHINLFTFLNKYMRECGYARVYVHNSHSIHLQSVATRAKKLPRYRQNREVRALASSLWFRHIRIMVCNYLNANHFSNFSEKVFNARHGCEFIVQLTSNTNF